MTLWPPIISVGHHRRWAVDSIPGALAMSMPLARAARFPDVAALAIAVRDRLRSRDRRGLAMRPAFDRAARVRAAHAMSEAHAGMAFAPTCLSLAAGLR